LSKTIPVLSLLYCRGWFFDRMKEVDEGEESKLSSSPTEALAEVKKRVSLFAFAVAREVEKKVI